MISRRIFTSRLCFRSLAMVTLALAILWATAQVYGHRGKTHGSSFTALQALQKATELYDKLVVSGKLQDNWETDLKKVDISDRGVKQLTQL